MPDITITLSDIDRSNLKTIMDLAIGAGVQDSPQLRHVRAAALVWQLLIKLETAEVAAANPPTETTKTQ